jgi:hypothetical protein
MVRNDVNIQFLCTHSTQPISAFTPNLTYGNRPRRPTYHEMSHRLINHLDLLQHLYCTCQATCSNPKCQLLSSSLCVLFVHNQERRSDRIILRDVTISGPYTISVSIPTITYIINCISVSMSNQATNGFFARTDALIVVQIPSRLTDYRVIPRRRLFF